VARIVVRPVRVEELAELVSLCAEHAAYEKSAFDRDGKVDSLRRAIFSAHPRLWCFVAEANGGIISYATCTREFSTWRAADFLYLDCLYVAPEYRNAGIGAEMMRIVSRHAGALGCTSVEWQTPAWNADAARFYARLGAEAAEKLRFAWTPEEPLR
jgi:GNAT superfamily N-acetyltransferase